MALEAATYLDQLVATNPQDSDQANTLGAQVRLVKQVLLDTFPKIGGAISGSDVAINAILTAFAAAGLSLTLPAPAGTTAAPTPATQGGSIQLAKSAAGAVTTTLSNQSEAFAITQGAADAYFSETGQLTLAGSMANVLLQPTGQATAVPVVPSGTIVMWHGTAQTIPAGWAQCNGSDGTPNLQDRVPIGAGDAYQAGQTGAFGTVSNSTPQEFFYGIFFIMKL